MVGDILIAFLIAAFIVGLVLPKRKEVSDKRDKYHDIFEG